MVTVKVEKTLGSALRECRNAAGMSQAHLARLLQERGVTASVSTIGHWEHDRHGPSAKQLSGACDVLEVDDAGRLALLRLAGENESSRVS
jgi:transcriptional regulator with XRE-family HTH domain